MLFRVAKITPTKNGQFVTLWKRSENGPIRPFDLEDPIDLIAIYAQKKGQVGLFVFPKARLQDQGVISEEKIGGKRAISIYPPWDKPTSAQARKTQE